ncbi:hypothetical protein ACHAXT_012876 [Thalassiosira profunda]
MARLARLRFLCAAAASLCVASFAAAARTAAFLPASNRGHRHRPSHHRRSCAPLLAKDGSGGSDAKTNQPDLLRGLESKLDYEGRISSKIIATEDDEDDSDVHPHRCGLATILGAPNQGKSTLLNALLADDLAIATARPQTTRHAILGVLTSENCQICLTDTPGIIGSPAYKLQEGMMDTVKGAARDADVFLVVADVFRITKSDDDDAEAPAEDLGIGEEMLAKLRKPGRPVIVCVNKVDLAAAADGDEGSVYANTPARAVEAIQRCRALLPDAVAILPTCAAEGPNDPGVVALRSMLTANDPGADVGSAIRGLGRPVPGMFANDAPMMSNGEARRLLPLGPPLYGPDFFTDRTDRFCASELIRETLFQSLGKELPYCCEVRVETFDESRRYADEDNGAGGGKKKSMIRIGAVILVERDSQKGIVVGKGGQKIKDVGVDARRRLQEFFGVKIFLDLRVKVDKNWRNNAEKLKKYGYM